MVFQAKTQAKCFLLNLTPRLTVLADVIDADGRVALAPIHDDRDQELKDAVSKALLALLASVTKVRSAVRTFRTKCNHEPR